MQGQVAKKTGPDGLWSGAEVYGRGGGGPGGEVGVEERGHRPMWHLAGVQVDKLVLCLPCAGAGAGNVQDMP